MTGDTVVLITEDDPGHAVLIERNLRRIGLGNQMQHFVDGQQVLDFLFEQRRKEGHRPRPYVLLLDIQLPKLDGVEVLRRVKEDPELTKIPVIMLTTADDPVEVQRCHRIGCSHYIRKPVEYDHFAAVLQQLGHFLLIVEVPDVDGALDS